VARPASSRFALTHPTPEVVGARGRRPARPASDGVRPDPWLLAVVADAIGDRAEAWQVTPAADSLDPWIVAAPVGHALPRQGWKLHVSSDVSTAVDTLARALPPLVGTGVSFKVLGSVTWLGRLNRGAAGLSQIGKFITVFPPDDATAVDVAIALERATRGLSGPRIPSDRPLTDGSVVSYRYGGFGDLCMQTRLGEIVLAVAAPDGRLIPDRRGTAPSEPPWVSDPFAARGLGARSSSAGTVARRYRPVLTLARSPAAIVQLALDPLVPRVCVLKRGRIRAGRDAPLRREVEVLRRMTDLTATAQLHDVVEVEGELVLVVEDLGGETLDQHVRRLMRTGRLPPTARVVELGVAIADALAVLHDRGRIHGDLKSANIVLTADGSVRLIDFDLAYPVRSSERPAGAGTRGYVSPECHRGENTSPSDDIFALGAVLYLLVTGAEPSRAPDDEHLLGRPPAQLNPDASPGVIRVLERCLSADPAERHGRARDVRDALLAAAADHADPSPPSRPWIAPERALDQARRAADALCAQAEVSIAGLTWRSRYFVGKGVVGRDINTGMSGTLLGLCELVDEFADKEHAEVLRAGAWTLHGLPAIPGEPTYGLYVGDAGVVAALLRAGQVLADEHLVAAAADRAARHPPALPDDSPDLFHGIAGRLLAELLLWDETGDPRALKRAVAHGDALVERAEGSSGEAWWRIPAGYADLSGTACLGYAHGAAGIADVLLDLADVTGESRYLDTARRAVAWIARQAAPVLEDRSGLGWPVSEGQRPSLPFWCHGATGIGCLLLHARGHDLGLELEPMLRKICRAVARGVRWSGPTLCHGLSGNAEFLLDAGRALGDDEALAQAHELMSIVDAYAVEVEGGRVWISDAPRQISPDYLVGFAGIPLVLLRLVTPDRPRQLTRSGFARRARRD
jgi:class IV lanthipeptide synthase